MLLASGKSFSVAPSESPKQLRGGSGGVQTIPTKWIGIVAKTHVNTPKLNKNPFKDDGAAGHRFSNVEGLKSSLEVMEMHTKVMQIHTKVMEMHEKRSKFKSKRNSCRCSTWLLLAAAVVAVNSRSGGAPGAWRFNGDGEERKSSSWRRRWW